MTSIKTRARRSTRRGCNDHVNDPYVKLAQKEGYRARAAYKLKEIDETLRLIKPGQLVVDLGSAPGAWSQYVRRTLRAAGAAAGELNGTIIALDLLPMEPIEGVHLPAGRFPRAGGAAPAGGGARRPPGRRGGVGHGAQPVGHRRRPTRRASPHLVELAVDFAVRHLKPDGALVCKVFHGSGYSQLVKLFKRQLPGRASRSSRRHRATSRRKPFWSASV